MENDVLILVRNSTVKFMLTNVLQHFCKYHASIDYFIEQEEACLGRGIFKLATEIMFHIITMPHSDRTFYTYYLDKRQPFQ